MLPKQIVPSKSPKPYLFTDSMNWPNQAIERTMLCEPEPPSNRTNQAVWTMKRSNPPSIALGMNEWITGTASIVSYHRSIVSNQQGLTRSMAHEQAEQDQGVAISRKRHRSRWKAFTHINNNFQVISLPGIRRINSFKVISSPPQWIR